MKKKEKELKSFDKEGMRGSGDSLRSSKDSSNQLKKENATSSRESQLKKEIKENQLKLSQKSSENLLGSSMGSPVVKRSNSSSLDKESSTSLKTSQTNQKTPTKDNLQGSGNGNSSRDLLQSKIKKEKEGQLTGSGNLRNSGQTGNNATSQLNSSINASINKTKTQNQLGGSSSSVGSLNSSNGGINGPLNGSGGSVGSQQSSSSLNGSGNQSTAYTHSPHKTREQSNLESASRASFLDTQNETKKTAMALKLTKQKRTRKEFESGNPNEISESYQLLKKAKLKKSTKQQVGLAGPVTPVDPLYKLTREVKMLNKIIQKPPKASTLLIGKKKYFRFHFENLLLKNTISNEMMKGSHHLIEHQHLLSPDTFLPAKKQFLSKFLVDKKPNEALDLEEKEKQTVQPSPGTPTDTKLAIPVDEKKEEVAAPVQAQIQPQPQPQPSPQSLTASPSIGSISSTAGSNSISQSNPPSTAASIPHDKTPPGSPSASKTISSISQVDPMRFGGSMHLRAGGVSTMFHPGQSIRQMGPSPRSYPNPNGPPPPTRGPPQNAILSGKEMSSRGPPPPTHNRHLGPLPPHSHLSPYGNPQPLMANLQPPPSSYRTRRRPYDMEIRHLDPYSLDTRSNAPPDRPPPPPMDRMPLERPPPPPNPPPSSIPLERPLSSGAPSSSSLNSSSSSSDRQSQPSIPTPSLLPSTSNSLPNSSNTQTAASPGATAPSTSAIQENRPGVPVESRNPPSGPPLSMSSSSTSGTSTPPIFDRSQMERLSGSADRMLSEKDRGLPFDPSRQRPSRWDPPPGSLDRSKMIRRPDERSSSSHLRSSSRDQFSYPPRELETTSASSGSTPSSTTASITTTSSSSIAQPSVSQPHTENDNMEIDEEQNNTQTASSTPSVLPSSTASNTNNPSSSNTANPPDPQLFSSVQHRHSGQPPSPSGPPKSSDMGLYPPSSGFIGMPYARGGYPMHGSGPRPVWVPRGPPVGGPRRDDYYSRRMYEGKGARDFHGYSSNPSFNDFHFQNNYKRR